MAPTPRTHLEELLAEESFVRSLAGALAGNENDIADEIVQQTWLHALQSPGPIDRPKSWLGRIARNVAFNLRRTDRRRADRERQAAVSERAPSSAELALREERRAELVRAVDQLPEPLREAVLLRWFEGLPPRRIAAVTGVPVTTVGNRLRRALQLLRTRLHAEHGSDRRAWLAPLAPTLLPRPPDPLPWIGSITMTAKTKIAAGLGGLLLLAGAYLMWPDSTAPEKPNPSATHPSGTAPLKVPTDASARERTDTEQNRVLVATDSKTAADTGTLHVRARRGGDTAGPAAGETLVILRRGDDRVVDTQTVRTDAEGQARVEGLVAGVWTVALRQNPKAAQAAEAEIVAGEVTELEYILPIGVLVRGVVLDPENRPVAGAEVDLVNFDYPPPKTIAVTGPDGRFAVHDVAPHGLVSARAAGYAASKLQMLMAVPGAAPGSTVDLRIQLIDAGGSVTGIVTDPDGDPVLGAMVMVGAGRGSGPIHGIGMPAIPVPVRTSAAGRFRAIGIAPGEHPVAVRAPGLAPFEGRCFVSANAVTSVSVAMQKGVAVRGLVLDPQGNTVSGVTVYSGDASHAKRFTLSRAEVGTDGVFALRGLAPGEIKVWTRHSHLGKASAILRGAAGDSLECDLQLSRGVELHGRVLDGAGSPMAGVMIHAEAGGKSSTSSTTDAEGRFTLANCPPDQILTVIAWSGIASGRPVSKRLENVDPRHGDVELRFENVTAKPPRPAPSAHIRGRVFGPDGQPVRGAAVSSYAAPRERGEASTAADGSFEIGPVRPGAWTVHVRSTEFPHHKSERRELSANDDWDLGRIDLIAGGTAVVNVVGAPAGKPPLFSIRDRDGNSGYFQAQWIADRKLRTYVLPPGGYKILLTSPGFAWRWIPFEVRAGEESRVEAKLSSGIRQRLEIVRADGTKPAKVAYSLRRGKVVFIERNWLYWDRAPVYGDDGAMLAELWLAPGEYDLHLYVSEQKVSSDTKFTVATREGRPLRIVLR